MSLLDIKFECTGCGQRLVVESSAAGLVTDCPNCRAGLEVPRHTPRHLQPGGEAEIDPETHLLRQELAGASLLAAELERQMAILHQKLVEARQENVSLRVESEWQAAVVAEKEEEAARLTSQVAELHGAFTAEAEARAELHEEREIARQLATAQAAQLSSREREVGEALALAGGLRDELHGLEGRLGAVEGELAQARADLREKRKLERRVAELREKEKEAQKLARTCAAYQEEVEGLKRQLSESAAGREVLALREKLRTTLEEAARAERSSSHASAEAEKARAAFAREQSICEQLLKRCEAAEKQAQSGSESTSESLRGIIERQKRELLEQYQLVGSLRRRQYGARMIYGLVVLIILGTAAGAVFWVQHSAAIAEWLK